MKLTVSACYLIVEVFAHGQTFETPVVPNSLQDVEGNAATSTPFNQTGVRFQQVYAASEVNSTPGWIRTIGFRVDVAPVGGQDFIATLTNIQMNLSTTPFGPDSLTPIFGNNIGLNEMTVYSGALNLMGRNLHLPGQPCFFEIEISLTNRFFYDPAQGNLLLDVRNYFGAPTTSFDAADTLGDSVSSLFALGADSTSGTLSTVGLVTRFVIDPVPEPSTWALVITSLAAFALFRRTRRKTRP